MPQINLTFNQVEEALGHMDAGERVQLFRKFDRDVAMARLDQLAGRARARLAKNPLSDDQITQIVESVREELYLAKKTRRSS